MTRALALALLVALSAVPLASPGAAAIPDDDSAPAAGLRCTERVPMTPVPNVIEAKWSPDSSTLAVVWFGRVPSDRTVTGWREEEILDLLDLRTGKLRPLGVGDRPEWSHSGRYVSYWGPNADELRITRDARVVAALTPTIPEVRWAGDTLVFIEKDEIRAWSDGEVRTLARLAEDAVPRYPRDDVYFSGDGERFTLTRYSRTGAVARFLGLTAVGELSPLDAEDATYVEWAPAGSTLLLRFPDRLEVRDLVGQTTTSIAVGAGIVHGWAADGRSLLLGRVSPTVPGGDTFDPFDIRWPTSRAAAAALPNVLGARAFSPNGKLFVGVGRTDRHDTALEIYRCADASRSAAPRSALEARTLMDKMDAGGRFVRPAPGDIAQFLQGRHTGVDLAAPFGSIIVAADEGVVEAVDWIPNGGNRVCVRHAASLQSCYFHTSAALVSAGERVARGQPVALVGMTGITTGPHVHWEATLNGRVVDPLGR